MSRIVKVILMYRRHNPIDLLMFCDNGPACTVERFIPINAQLELVVWSNFRGFRPLFVCGKYV
jgi:hypothetical protein